MLAAMYDSSDTLGRSLNKAMVQRDRRASEASQLHDEARELKERLEHTRTLTFGTWRTAPALMRCHSLAAWLIAPALLHWREQRLEPSVGHSGSA